MPRESKEKLNREGERGCAEADLEKWLENLKVRPGFKKKYTQNRMLNKRGRLVRKDPEGKAVQRFVARAESFRYAAATRPDLSDTDWYRNAAEKNFLRGTKRGGREAR